MPQGTEGIVSCAERLRVLADDTRIAVIQQLMDGPRRVHEINRALGLEQSLLSHHLKVLREARIVMAQRDGKAVLYWLTPEVKSMINEHAIELGCCQLVFNEQLTFNESDG
jgi:DNA-binding transcriptional ArsR family regulator